jgi:protein HIRA/HIR1
VRVWSTAPILNESVEVAINEGRIKNGGKCLATLSMHAGPVLCVRWSKSGRWLASGSDDSVVLVWDLDVSSGSRVGFGGEKNIENWKPLKRLTGHDSDVVGLDWSTGDRYLASCGLDSTVMVWDGRTLGGSITLSRKP